MASNELVLTGVVKGGKLTVRHRKQFDAWLKKLHEGEVIVTVEKAHATRSLEQNRLYFAGYVNPIAEYTGYSPKWVHAYLKKRFLPANRLLIQDATGVVVDDVEVDALTTTTLNKVEFGEYLHAIEEFAIGLGVVVGSNREAAA